MNTALNTALNTTANNTATGIVPATNTNTNTLHQRAQPWLGTLVEIGFYAPAKNNAHKNLKPENAHADSAAVNSAFDAAFAACQRIHLAMSPALPDSDISRFNRAEAGAIIHCDAWTMRVLHIAARLQKASAGLFDIAQGSGGFCCKDARHVLKENTSTVLNVGGIAKGFAVDRMISTLRAHGIKNGYVNAGGDLRVFGDLDWPICLRQPDHQPALASINLRQGSIASSAFKAGISPFQGDTLIDPATQDICRKNIAVSVAAPRCVFADALTKVVALSGNIQHPLLQQLNARAWIH